ncbi:hypothetical protein QBC36DRAFT_319775 [Triangularia setosa]|uniref:Zn(2)-C6 fungal-type domain-containing protein n=1 Tax=Triangularia setosa TaxID=2587417 RepID=A0AAN6WG86_9PEZI|nr:hypothetical protein QBC36DRAFT_319775 [Podospora setosa]
MNTQAAKRYACDRCREQKLKCPRPQSDGGSCERCLRLGAMCVTSSGRPLGRPPIHANHRVQGGDPLYDARRNRASSLRGLCIPMSTGSLSTQPESQTSDNGSTQYSPSNRTSNRSSTASTFWMNPPNFSTAMSTTETHTISSPGAQSHAFNYYLSNIPDLDLGDLNGMAGHHLNRGLHEPIGHLDDKDTGSGQSGIDTPSTSNAGEGSAPTVDTLGSISRQLAELKDQSWESWSPHLNHHGQDLEMAENSQDLNGGWNRVLNLTMRYATVLQIVAPGGAAPTSPHPPAALSLTLMLLSTHIQLTELLEIVFARLRDCLHEAPVATVSASAAEAPYMAQTTNIQIMMMTQVFECQMQTVERLMGLPSQYRIWSHRDSDAGAAGGGGGGVGVLGRENMSELVRAVMNQALDTIQSIRQISDAIKRSWR